MWSLKARKWYASTNRSGFKGAGRLVACPAQEERERKRKGAVYRSEGGKRWA